MPKNTAQRIIDSATSRFGVVTVGVGGGIPTVPSHGELVGLGDDDHPQYHNDTRGDLRYVPLARQVVAGNGLAGGGALSADATLSVNAGAGLVLSGDDVTVGAGLGITVNADDVALASSVAGAGLTYDTGVLAVGVANTGAAGLTAEADTLRLTSSAAGAADAHILATDADGYTAVVKLRTPTIDTASGALSLAPNSGLVSLPSAVAIGTDNYASQLTGWRATYAGEADFRYLFVDEMHAKSFIADLEQALAGGQIISKSVAMIGGTGFTVPAAGASATLQVRDLPSAQDMAVFESGDYIRLRQFSRASGSLTIADCWGVVTDYVDGDGSNFTEGQQRWTFTRESAPYAGTMAADTVLAADSLVLDYGTDGSGYYEVNAIDGLYGLNSPYARIVKWTGHPATGQFVVGQFGNLRGAYGYTGTEYGLAVGQYASGKANITIDPTNGVRLRSHSTDILQIKNSDGLGYIVGPLYLDTAGGIYQGTGTFASPTTGIKLSNVSGYGKLGAYYGGVAQTVFDDQGLALQYNVTVSGTTYGSQSSVIWYATPVSRATPIGRLYVSQSPNFVYAPDVVPENRVPALYYKSYVSDSYPDIVLEKPDGTLASVWHQGNDGASSGLDADTLDSLHAASFALLSGAAFTGDISITSSGDFILGLNSGTTKLFSVRNNSTDVVHLNTQNSARLALGVSTGTTTGSIVEQVTLLSTGYMGFGATNPATNVDIAGSGWTGIRLRQRSDAASASGALYFETSTSGNYAIRGDAGKLSFYRGAILGSGGGTLSVTLDSDGDVLIGTDSNTYDAKLNVAGNIHSSAVITAESYFQLKKVTSAPSKPGAGWVRFFAKSTGLGDARFQFCVITENSTVEDPYEVIYEEPS